MSGMTDVAVIGAGPYGLSVAAHLRGRGIDHRVIGIPMETWLKHMPKGMMLKSDGFASSLSAPNDEFPLRKYCAERGIPYDDMAIPVKIETFSAYGLAFQKRFAPDLEQKRLVGLEQVPQGFLVRLDNGESFIARRVVLALGIHYLKRIPDEIAHLPPEYASHASEHPEFDRLRGRDVTVLGGGSSAVDIAGLMHEDGIRVRLICRKPEIEFHPPPKLPRPIHAKLRDPMSTLGPSWAYCFYAYMPWAFRLLPLKTRLRLVRTVLGPAAGYFMRGRVVGKIETLLGTKVRGAEIVDGKVRLMLEGADGTRSDVLTDHVLAGTGYKTNLDRYSFLSPELRAQLKDVERTPVLNSHFESSVSGLYFIGPPAANSFGPVMRFACGCDFAAKRVSAHLARNRARVPTGAKAAGAMPATALHKQGAD